MRARMPEGRPTRRVRKLYLEPEGASDAPRKGVLKPRSAVHLAERFAHRAPVAFTQSGISADLLEKRLCTQQ